MSCGLRRDWMIIWALLASMAAATDMNTPNLSEPDGRIFLNNLNSTLIPLGAGGALLVSAVVVVAVIIGIILICLLIFNPHSLKGGQGVFGPWFGGGGYSNSQYQQGGGQYYAPQTQNYLYEPYSKLGYQTPQSRSNDNQLDWDSLKILDYISMMDDMWRKLDVKDVGCQKRVLCELHQNESALGPAASKIVKAFGYARYLNMLNIPDGLKNMLEDYQDAADKGRSLKDQDCKDVFDSCDFSVKETFLKKFQNNQE